MKIFFDPVKYQGLELKSKYLLQKYLEDFADQKLRIKIIVSQSFCHSLQKRQNYSWKTVEKAQGPESFSSKLFQTRWRALKKQTSDYWSLDCF